MKLCLKKCCLISWRWRDNLIKFLFQKSAGRQVHDWSYRWRFDAMNIHKGKTQTVSGASRLYLGDTIYVVVKKSEIGKIKDILL